MAGNDAEAANMRAGLYAGAGAAPADQSAADLDHGNSGPEPGQQRRRRQHLVMAADLAPGGDLTTQPVGVRKADLLRLVGVVPVFAHAGTKHEQLRSVKTMRSIIAGCGCLGAG